MNTPTTTPPRDSSPFFISSVNSYNRFAKRPKAAARRELKVMNEEPKVPALLNALKVAAVPRKVAPPVKKDVKVPAAAVNPGRKPLAEKTNQKPLVVRQITTPPSTRVARRDSKPPVKAPVKAPVVPKKTPAAPKPVVVTPRKVQTTPKPVVIAPRKVQPAPKPVVATPKVPTKPIVSVKSKPASPKVPHPAQLVTPPPTPPAAPVAKKAAPKPVVSRIPTTKVVKPILGDASPKPRVKAIAAKGVPVIPQRVLKSPTKLASVPTPVKAVVAVPTVEADIARATPTKICVTTTDIDVVSATPTKALPVSEQPCVEAEPEEVAVVANTDRLSPSPTPETKRRTPSPEHLLAINQLKAVLAQRAEAHVKSVAQRKEVVKEPVPSPEHSVTIDQLKKVLASRAEAAALPAAQLEDVVKKPVTSPEHELTITQLKSVLARRAENAAASLSAPKEVTAVRKNKSVTSPEHARAIGQLKSVVARRWKEAAAASLTPRKEVIEEVVVTEAKTLLTPEVKAVVASEETARAATPSKSDVVRDNAKTVGGAVSGGIKARMAALFGNASAASSGPVIAPPAFVRRMKIPELDASSQASQNQRTQREVETLRTLGRVGSAGRDIVKTKAFGGSMEANYAAKESTAPSLEWMAIVARRKQELKEEL